MFLISFDSGMFAFLKVPAVECCPHSHRKECASLESLPTLRQAEAFREDFTGKIVAKGKLGNRPSMAICNGIVLQGSVVARSACTCRVACPLPMHLSSGSDNVEEQGTTDYSQQVSDQQVELKGDPTFYWMTGLSIFF